MDKDKDAQVAVEEKEDKPGQPGRDVPAAGPHAKPSLTDRDKTPGAGSLPDDDAAVTPGAG